MLKNEDIVELRNFGYSFVVVNWKNSRRDIKDNAMCFVRLLDYLKQVYSDSDHEFVVIGESMGGLVARYGLTFMETEDYINGYTAKDAHHLHNLYTPQYYPAFNPYLMHKTRLFITFDTPHQGANIPLAYQELYDYGVDKALGGKFLSAIFRFGLAEIGDLFLGSDAAQQMLIYHAYTRNGFATTNNEYYYYEHGEKEQFFEQLEQMGDYPQYPKTMAMSNGSLRGYNQTRPYAGQQLRSPNDYLLDFEAQIYGRIFRNIRIPVFGTKLVLRTNPNGYGQLMNLEAGTWGVKIKLYWFGVKVKVGLNSLLEHEVYAGNTKPYCVGAGSHVMTFNIIPNISPVEREWPRGFPLLGYSFGSDGDGTFTFDAQVGIPWVAGVGASMQMYSDGVHFNFIPTASALDWGYLPQTDPLGENFQAMSLANFLSGTPFDLISGIHSSHVLTRANRFNRDHLNVENRDFEDRRTLESCPELQQYILNKEIGDEILYLNNRNLPYRARFEAEKVIDGTYGANNPHYDYVGQTTFDFPRFRGFYSKSLDFHTLSSHPYGLGPNPEADLRFEQMHMPGPYLFNEYQGTVWVCCNPAELYKTSSALNEEDEVDVEEIKVYPNPFNTALTLSLRNLKVGSYTVDFLDLLGRSLWTQKIDVEQGVEYKKSIPADVPQGVYLLRIMDAQNQAIYQQRLIKQ